MRERGEDGARRGQLTGKPFRIGMGCHTQPQKLAAGLPQDEKSIHKPKRDRRHHEHVDRRDSVGVIVNKRSSSPATAAVIFSPCISPRWSGRHPCRA
jgi:hypothetical protein